MRTRTVPLASRAHLCINEDLRAKGGDLDEGCRDLLSGQAYNFLSNVGLLTPTCHTVEKKEKRCPHLPAFDEEARMLDLRDQILVRGSPDADFANMKFLSSLSPKGLSQGHRRSGASG